MHWFVIGAGIAGLIAFAELARRVLPARERYHAVVAVGISPLAVLDRVEAAVVALAPYELVRAGDVLLIHRPRGLAHLGEIGDRLAVTATAMEVGTRVEIVGFIEPAVIAAIRNTLARTPPWFSAG